MNERELLEMIAEDAPEPSPHYIDAVIRSAGRARSRRRIAMLAAAPALTAVAAALAITAWPDHGAQSSTAVMARNLAAAPYAAAIRIEIASDSGNRPPPVLYVVDHTCAGVDKMPPLIGCAGQPLARGLRHDLAAALRSYAPVDFVPAGGPSVRDKNLTVRNGGFLVVLGPIRLDGPHADVPIAIERAADDGRGGTLALTNRGGRWVIANPPGKATYSWIS